MKKNLLGFTLVELLVVISIIGVLATLLLANYNSARGRARDAQRKSDVREIQTALELFKNSQKPPAYPATWRTALSATPVYMKAVPYDPLCPAGTCSNWTDYSYTRDASDTLKYTLVACLENASDPQKDQPTVVCGTGVKYTRTEP